jgi:hypothetical protein
VKLWAFKHHQRYCNAKVVGHIDERSGGEEALTTRALILILGIVIQGGTKGQSHDGLSARQNNRANGFESRLIKRCR